MAVFWEMMDLPVFCNVLCKTKEEARQVPRGDIRLEVCQECGFVHNVAFDSRHVQYDAQYENSLHFSPTFQNYAKRLAAELVERHHLRGRRIVEIACGKGDFLRLLCKGGENTGMGFDPGYVMEPGTRDSAVTIIPEAYGERHRDHRADLVCCRHALEHMADPIAFLRVVRANIGDRRDCVVFFEVPNVQSMLCELGIWDILYEHCSYFWQGSLERCFIESGFAVESVRDAYAGQFLCIEARASLGGGECVIPAAVDTVVFVREISAFAGRFAKKLLDWKNRLGELAKSGERLVVWGSGSKGVTFLNMTKGLGEIAYVVDINPRKQGMYVAGTGQQIVAPAFLREYKPDYVIVMNPIYREEIHSAMSVLGLNARLLVA